MAMPNFNTLVERARDNVRKFKEKQKEEEKQKLDKWIKNHKYWFEKLEEEIIRASEQGQTQLVLDYIIKNSEDIKEYSRDDLDTFATVVHDMNIKNLNVEDDIKREVTIVSWK